MFILCIRLRFSLDGDQLDRSTLSEVRSEKLMIDFKVLKKNYVNKRKKLSWISIAVIFVMVVDFISFLKVHSRYRLQRLVHNENNCRRIFLEIWYKYQQRHIMLSQLHVISKYLFLHMLTKDQGTSLLSVAATGLASITTKHNHTNKIKCLIIFQVIDSKITKLSVHFSMSSFKEIILMFDPMCWIDLHY